MANVNRDPKKHRAMRPADFDPYARRERQGVAITTENIGLLRQLVPAQRRKRRS